MLVREYATQSIKHAYEINFFLGDIYICVFSECNKSGVTYLRLHKCFVFCISEFSTVFQGSLSWKIKKATAPPNI